MVQNLITGLGARFRRANNDSRARMAQIFDAYVVEFETLIGMRL